MTEIRHLAYKLIILFKNRKGLQTVRLLKSIWDENLSEVNCENKDCKNKTSGLQKLQSKLLNEYKLKQDLIDEGAEIRKL